MAYNPYAVIREYWGEELSPELIERMLGAPEDHYDVFGDAYLDYEPGLCPLPPLAAGHMRPVLTYTASDELRRSAGAFRQVPLLLLYAHEVVVSFPNSGVVSRDLGHRSETLQWLLSVKPLFEMGIIHVRADDSAKLHPAFAHKADRFERLARQLAADPTSAVARFRERWDQTAAGAPTPGPAYDDRDAPLWRLALDASAHNDHEARYGRKAHRLFKSQAELDLWSEFSGRRPRVQERVGAKFLSLDVPNFEQSIAELVAIRRSSEAFAEWRSALASAVMNVAPGDEVSIERPAETRRDLAEQLAPLAERINEETKRSNVLASLRSGAKEFGLGAVPSTAAIAAGGSLGQALASGVATSAVQAAVHYRGRRASLAREAALGKLAMLFFDDNDGP